MWECGFRGHIPVAPTSLFREIAVLGTSFMSMTGGTSMNVFLDLELTESSRLQDSKPSVSSRIYTK